jgi:thymidylate synthase (FAD)
MTDLVDQVAYCARVSNPGNQKMNKGNLGLIKYLIKNGHWSPFEMVSITLEIKTTRDISRQILRHRSFSFQEFSQRYAVVDEDLVVRETRLQDNKNRQNSFESNDEALNDEWENRQKIINDVIKDNYNWSITNGIAKEQARCILPEGNTPTTLYVHGTVRSWIHYLKARLDTSTQKEHREIAYLCMLEIKKAFSIIEDVCIVCLR